MRRFTTTVQSGVRYPLPHTSPKWLWLQIAKFEHGWCFLLSGVPLLCIMCVCLCVCVLSLNPLVVGRGARRQRRYGAHAKSQLPHEYSLRLRGVTGATTCPWRPSPHMWGNGDSNREWVCLIAESQCFECVGLRVLGGSAGMRVPVFARVAVRGKRAGESVCGDACLLGVCVRVSAGVNSMRCW